MSDPNVRQAAALPDGLAEYFATRDRSRVDAVNRALRTLTPYERRLVLEACVMGYVRGAMAGRSRATLGEGREGDIRADAEVLFEVIDACISMSDFYPFLTAASDGKRLRINRSRRWPGE